MIEQLTQNWICWAILLLALLCYQQLWLEYLAQRTQLTHSDSDRAEQTESLKHEFSGVLIGALPLMGLLGTIIGLLDCFAGMSREGANGDLVSGGIADALLTTQLGLVCAIPGWLLQAWVRFSSNRLPLTASADVSNEMAVR